MKKVIVGISLFLILGVGLFLVFSKDGLNRSKKEMVSLTITVIPSKKDKSGLTADSGKDKKEIKESVFVPYWSNFSKLSESVLDYQRIIYFGITIDEKGLVKNEPGFSRLPSFIDAVGDREQWLTLRMTNTETNLSFLGSKDPWKKAVGEVIKVVKKNDFQGLALDLEISAIAFTDLKNQVNDFIEYLFRQVKKEHISFAVILYGDTIYRKRPFDLPVVNQFSDEVMIMAYDFHKSRGEPGPNFPLRGKEKYGYDMNQMISDFSSFIPKNKLTVIFGMFGYDWLVDEKKRPLTKAKSLSLREIRSRYLKNCTPKNCLVVVDSLSGEKEIDFVRSKVKDEFGYIYPHIIWFEDEESVKKKKTFLKAKGVKSFAYWAWGYFDDDR